MRARKSGIVLGLGIGIASVGFVACTGGAGPLVGLDSYDKPPNTYEKPGLGRESPGPGRDNPGPSTNDHPPAPAENPGQQGGGPVGAPGGGGACPPCDTKYDCQVAASENGQSINGQSDISLKTTDTGCSAGKGLVLACGGGLTSGGQSVGTWTASGDNLTLNVDETDPDGGAKVKATFTCTKAATSTGVGDGGGGPNPGPPPPTPIQDAGGFG